VIKEVYEASRVITEVPSRRREARAKTDDRCASGVGAVKNTSRQIITGRQVGSGGIHEHYV
jgi:hypothetical protein